MYLIKEISFTLTFYDEFFLTFDMNTLWNINYVVYTVYLVYKIPINVSKYIHHYLYNREAYSIFPVEIVFNGFRRSGASAK